MEKTVKKFDFTPTQTNSKLTVCSSLDNTCHNLNTKVDLGVTFHNELLNNNDTFDISALILKETPVDIISGRDTIKMYKLFEKIPSQLSSDGFNHFRLLHLLGLAHHYLTDLESYQKVYAF